MVASFVGNRTIWRKAGGGKTNYGRPGWVGRNQLDEKYQMSYWSEPGMRPVTTNTVRLATETAWSAKRS